MLLYSTFLCKKIANAPGGHKKFMLTKLGGGGGGGGGGGRSYFPYRSSTVVGRTFPAYDRLGYSN